MTAGSSPSRTSRLSGSVAASSDSSTTSGARNRTLSQRCRVFCTSSCKHSWRDTRCVSPLLSRKSPTTASDRNSETISALSRRFPNGAALRPSSPATQKRHSLSSNPSGQVKRTRRSSSGPTARRRARRRYPSSGRRSGFRTHAKQVMPLRALDPLSGSSPTRTKLRLVTSPSGLAKGRKRLSGSRR